MARLTRSHLHNTGKLTETVTEATTETWYSFQVERDHADHPPWVCLQHPAGFTLVFAHGNLDDSTTFKTVNRDEMVAPAIARQGAGGEVAEALPPSFAPSLESMMGAESPTEFRDLEPEDNAILESYPNHCLINTNIFSEVKGAKQISSKDLAFNLVEAFQLSVVDDDEISVEREAEAAGLENILAILWASENGLLKEIRLDDVPECHDEPPYQRVKQKLTGRTAAGSGRGSDEVRRGNTSGRNTHRGSGERDQHGDDGSVVTEHGGPTEPLPGRERSGPPTERIREVDPQNHGTNAKRAIHISLHEANERSPGHVRLHAQSHNQQDPPESNQSDPVRNQGLGRNLL
ncbi:hypothetical protein MHU86_7094 [Fragilaria crotonensis]|nr:hypothetical protein MHU86_7094 [Fragilaria crotonensis]